MVMEGYYGHERLPELWSRINALHLSYLQMDDNPKKLEHRNKLEDCIKEFLCIAPHGRKFCFKETAEVLHRSASNKKDFSGYKAALGWTAIGMYAGNLMSQPWRQEYREIKMYSGFYKHQIEANLVGAEIMFEAMGYKHAGNGVMVLDGPICPDHVANVSQDSLVAYVECQILKEIWEEVCAASFKVSWLEVLQFRESHLCGPQKSTEALKYQMQQRQFHEHHHSRSYSHGNAEDYAAASNSNFRYHQHITSPAYPAANHSFPPLVPVLPPPPAPAYGYSNGYNYAPTYGVIPTHYTFPPNMTNYVNKPYNNYYCNGGYHNIPTGQLIEIGSGNNQGFDVTDAPPVPKNTVVTAELTQKNGTSKPEVGFENWEYVYKNLESQGYSKDLGERGDLLKSEKRNAVVQQPQYDVPPDRPLKINEALEKLKLIDHKPENPKPSELSSSYENLSAQDLRPAAKASKTLTSKIKANVIEKLDPKKKDKKVSKNIGDRWECGACTFLNGNSSNICDMCGKSRVRVSQEMEIGGSECSKCTLVNPKDRKVCEACGASLHNSPTYI